MRFWVVWRRTSWPVLGETRVISPPVKVVLPSVTMALTGPFVTQTFSLKVSENALQVVDVLITQIQAIRITQEKDACDTIHECSLPWLKKQVY
jgi:hypothetical protein